MLNSIIGKFLRWYRANRIKFLTYVGGAVLAYALIMTFNSNAKENNKNDGINNTDTSQQVSTNIEEASKSTIESSTTIIGGSSKSEVEIDKANNLVNTFVNFCNQGKFENAYNLISDDCKNALYPTVDVFITEYCNKIFNCVKTYSIQNYSGDTYRVIYKDSLLETGGNATSAEKADYITVTDENNKISISSYIGKEVINEEKSIDYLKFTVIEKDIYVEYEVYKLNIANESIYDATISNLTSSGEIYVRDSNNDFSFVVLNELTSADVTINAGIIKNIELKFSKPYSKTSKVENICFRNIALNSVYESETKEISIEI